MDSSANFYVPIGNINSALTTEVVLWLVLLAIVLLLSGLVSASQIAYYSLTPSHIKRLKANKTSKNDGRVLKNLTRPEHLNATLMVCGSFVNIAFVIMATYIMNAMFAFDCSPALAFAIELAVISFILLLFGRMVPRMLASSYPAPFARAMALPLLILIKICRPITLLMVGTTKRSSSNRSGCDLSMDELSNALETTDLPDSNEDRRILKGIATFGNTLVNEIMKPRVDVVAVEYSTPFSALVQAAMDSGYSRIPVYVDTFDSIKGILYIKDLIPYIDRDDTFQWQNLMREAYFVPESKKINDLLTEFQQKKNHLAIVVDEYGGNNGIITLEDILEEIVGEISDESDEEEKLYTKINDHTYLFEGKIQINDFCKIVNCSNEIFDSVRGEAETLAGLILEITGHLPASNYALTHKQFRFIIDSVDNRRIKKIKVEITPHADHKKK